MNHPSEITEVIQNIHNLLGSYEEAIELYRNNEKKYSDINDIEAHKRSAVFWVDLAFLHSLIKLRILINNNFSHIETVGLLGVTRYIFEITVWLKLLVKDSLYGYVYYYDLITKNKYHYSDLKSHLQKEIIFMQMLDDREQELTKSRVEELSKITDEKEQIVAAMNLSKQVEQEIDSEAARRLCIYSEDAMSNGYAFQAHLIETKAIPDIDSKINACQKDIDNLELSLPDDIKKIAHARWNWKQSAKKVGMEDEYEFIYTFSSRLLHATPASVVTDKKNLEDGEILIFLKYILIQMRTVLGIANENLKKRISQH